MLGTDPESYITKYTLVYTNKLDRRSPHKYLLFVSPQHCAGSAAPPETPPPPHDQASWLTGRVRHRGARGVRLIASAQAIPPALARLQRSPSEVRCGARSRARGLVRRGLLDGWRQRQLDDRLRERGLVAADARHSPRGTWCQHLNSFQEGAALEATQGQMDSFFSQLPYKCYLEEVASVGD